MKVIEIDGEPFVCYWCGAAVLRHDIMGGPALWVHVEGYLMACRNADGTYLNPVRSAEPVTWGYAMEGKRRA